MLGPSAAWSIPLCLLLAAALVAAACAGPSPTPAGGPQPTLSPTLMTPAAPGLSATLAQPPVAAPQEVTPVSFSKEFLPLFRQRCTACHIDQRMGGLSLSGYNSLMKGGESGLAVIIGSPQTSLLAQKLAGNPLVGERMPKGGPYLTEETIRKVADWIRQGAPNN